MLTDEFPEPEPKPESELEPEPEPQVEPEPEFIFPTIDAKPETEDPELHLVYTVAQPSRSRRFNKKNKKNYKNKKISSEMLRRQYYRQKIF